MKETLLKKDAELSARIRASAQTRPGRILAIFLAHSGDSWFWVAGMVLLWFLGSEYWQGRALILTAAMLATGTIVMVLKYTIRRPRPQGEWGQIYRKTDPHSFPSGHAARALMLPVVALGLGPLWFGLLLLVWGPLVGLGRVAMGVHYLLDIVVGGLVGVLVGVVVLFAISGFAPL